MAQSSHSRHTLRLLSAFTASAFALLLVISVQGGMVPSPAALITPRSRIYMSRNPSLTGDPVLRKAAESPETSIAPASRETSDRPPMTFGAGRQQARAYCVCTCEYRNAAMNASYALCPAVANGYSCPTTRWYYVEASADSDCSVLAESTSCSGYDSMGAWQGGGTLSCSKHVARDGYVTE